MLLCAHTGRLRTAGPTRIALFHRQLCFQTLQMHIYDATLATCIDHTPDGTECHPYHPMLAKH